MPAAVSNSSPLIHLARIGRLGLLRTLFSPITIPGAVHREVVSEGNDRPGASEVARAVADGWLTVAAVVDSPGLQQLRAGLDEGEAEAIQLALQLQPDRVLLDEAPARRQAERLRLKVTGTLGALLRAKQTGLLPSVAEELRRLQADGGFHIAPHLVAQILTAAGE